MAHEEYIRLIPASDTAIMFIHGILGTPDHFQKLIPLVPEDWSICNLLLPGHGGTVRDFSASSMDQWQKYVEETFNKLRKSHKRIFIAAHSMGTLLAIEQAVKSPEQIAGLFLLAVPLRLGLRWQMVKNAWSVYRNNTPSDDPLLRATRAACSIQQDRNLLLYLGWIPRYLELFSLMGSVRRKLPRLKVPGIAFQSRLDEMVSLRSVRDMERNNVLHVCLLPDSRHFYYADKDLSTVLEAFSRFISVQKEAS